MSAPAVSPVAVVPFSAAWAEDESDVVNRLRAAARRDASREARVDALARQLIEAIRNQSHGLGGVEDLLREFSLSTREGLALMVLAEALLRVPDKATTDFLIEDKLGQGDFAHHLARSDAWLAHASAWALGASARIIHPGETPQGVLAQLAKRLGRPAVRLATRRAMAVLASHFVLGETIGEALGRATAGAQRLQRYSFDMLGEAARTHDQAETYFAAYSDAIQAIGKSAHTDGLPNRPGISVKLSALHPRYEALNSEAVIRELTPRLVELARQARSFDLNLTVDAEEADRLELSLDVIGGAFTDASLAHWDGFGLAVQAYQQRAAAVIDWVEALASGRNRCVMVRLVKGAYWDTEIKRAQERGLAQYPVFTRKAATDLNYLACAEKLLAARPRLFPQFATHNALTVASLVERAGAGGDFEFQRLHGMGDALYRELRTARPELACRTYAPVGGHRDLLAYLVRRLLENGANSSFVAASTDPQTPIDDLLKRPQAVLDDAGQKRSQLLLPPDLFGAARKNSAGIEFGHRASLQGLCEKIDAARGPASAAVVIDGREEGSLRACLSCIDNQPIGDCRDASLTDADRAMQAAHNGFAAWSGSPVEYRATALERAALGIEAQSARLIHLLQVEAGKTLDDCFAEVREAIDFCRYYAAQARLHFASPQRLPGPTGETNDLFLRGRGVFVAISPWNFPLAIFVGQIAAALAAGNSVVAKPAGQTPLIAAEMTRLLHRAGVPTSALHLLPGDAHIGARLVAHARTAGVVFTGSGDTARQINRSLAARDGAIASLIAETGGVNAMIVDATALPEHVADDVVASAFRSAGQRCSALRLLCLQEDVADRMLAMIIGATRQLKVGDPRVLATQMGPVIDADTKQRLAAWIARMQAEGRVRFAGVAPSGLFVAPHIVELDTAGDLKQEIFGPVLHVVRYAAGQLDDVIAAIAASGYGLTLGIHSRIEARVQHIIERLGVGNVYVNRNMIGAVVGVQPFGGAQLSGTGPKAGGPHYLPRFGLEQTVTVNTAAAGGNASLLGGGA